MSTERYPIPCGIAPHCSVSGTVLIDTNDTKEATALLNLVINLRMATWGHHKQRWYCAQNLKHHKSRETIIMAHIKSQKVLSDEKWQCQLVWSLCTDGKAQSIFHVMTTWWKNIWCRICENDWYFHNSERTQDQMQTHCTMYTHRFRSINLSP